MITQNCSLTSWSHSKSFVWRRCNCDAAPLVFGLRMVEAKDTTRSIVICDTTRLTFLSEVSSIRSSDGYTTGEIISECDPTGLSFGHTAGACRSRDHKSQKENESEMGHRWIEAETGKQLQSCQSTAPLLYMPLFCYPFTWFFVQNITMKVSNSITVFETPEMNILPYPHPLWKSTFCWRG